MPKGFIGKADEETLWLRHILDSLLVLNRPIEFGEKIVDLGTGAGLPGIPLAIVMLSMKKSAMHEKVKNKRFLLIDSSRKKIAFLEKIKERLSLKNTVIYASNISPISHANHTTKKKEFEKHDTVIFRAFQKPLASFELALHHLKPKGKIIYWRSKPFLQEENYQVHEKMIHRMSELGIQVSEYVSLKTPKKLGNRGVYLVIKDKEPGFNFPRSLNDILHDPICRL